MWSCAVWLCLVSTAAQGSAVSRGHVVLKPASITKAFSLSCPGVARHPCSCDEAQLCLPWHRWEGGGWEATPDQDTCCYCITARAILLPLSLLPHQSGSFWPVMVLLESNALKSSSWSRQTPHLILLSAPRPRRVFPAKSCFGLQPNDFRHF